MITEVEKFFDDNLKARFSQKQEVLKFLLSHEKKRVCLESLCDQIRMAEIGIKSFDVWKYYSLIKAVSDMFAGTALEAHKQKIMSRNEQRVLQEKNEIKKQMEQVLTEVPDESALFK